MNMGFAWTARLIAVVFIIGAWFVQRESGSRTAFWVLIIIGAASVLFAAVRSLAPKKNLNLEAVGRRPTTDDERK